MHVYVCMYIIMIILCSIHVFSHVRCDPCHRVVARSPPMHRNSTALAIPPPPQDLEKREVGGIPQICADATVRRKTSIKSKPQTCLYVHVIHVIHVIHIYIYIYIYIIISSSSRAAEICGLESLSGSRQPYGRPRFTGMCMKHRGVRLHRMRDFKQH